MVNWNRLMMEAIHAKTEAEFEVKKAEYCDKASEVLGLEKVARIKPNAVTEQDTRVEQ